MRALRLTGRSATGMNAGWPIVLEEWSSAELRDFLLNALVLIVILGASAFITGWFTRTMYIRCEACGTLNARRRIECRSCQMKIQ